MQRRPIIYLVLVLCAFSCAQHPNQSSAFSDQVHIDNGVNRGFFFENSTGIKNGLTYIPVSITNESGKTWELHLKFAEEYDFPDSSNNEKFQLVVLPEIWALDGVDITDEMIKELPTYLQSERFSKEIKPKETMVLAIGTYRQVPSISSVPIPNELFIQSEKGLLNECAFYGPEEPVSDTSTALWLKLLVDINTDAPWCISVPCGQLICKEN